MAYADFCLITTTGFPERRCALRLRVATIFFVSLLMARIRSVTTGYAWALFTRFALFPELHPTNISTAGEADLPG
jgi:hypothetical protein